MRRWRVQMVYRASPECARRSGAHVPRLWHAFGGWRQRDCQIANLIRNDKRTHAALQLLSVNFIPIGRVHDIAEPFVHNERERASGPSAGAPRDLPVSHTAVSQRDGGTRCGRAVCEQY